MFNEEDEDFDSIEELLQNYRSLLLGNPSQKFLEAEDFEIIIDYFVQNHRFEKADEALSHGLKFHPQSVALLFIKSEMLFGRQNYGQAVSVLSTINEIHPMYIPAIILHADILMEINKDEEAIQLLQSSINEADGYEKIELLMALSDIYDEQARFEKVFDTLITVLEIDASYFEALFKMSFWADLADKNKESIAFHKKLIDNDPFNTVAWYNIASGHHSLKEYEAAIDAYENCIALDGQLEAAYRNVADAYMKVKRFDDAIYSLEKNLEIARPEDILYEAMGQCFEKKKDYKQARYFYRKAIQLNPNDDLFFYKIGSTYFREKKYELAYESFKSAFKLDETNHQYALALGNCQLESENEKDAIVYFLKSLSLKPNQKNAWVQLSKALYALGLFEEIINQKEIAEEHCGIKAEFEYIHTAALYALGKTKEALIYLQKGLELAPNKIKLLATLQPDIYTRKSVADLVAFYKKK